MEQKKQNHACAPKVKICGITTMKEADWLNAVGADYAGFVFYEKSRRSVSITDAAMIKKSLYPSVKTVAVTVSPTVDELRAIEIAGFDILQVHKELSLEVLRECRLPVWRAFNLRTLADMREPGQSGSRESKLSAGDAADREAELSAGDAGDREAEKSAGDAGGREVERSVGDDKEQPIESAAEQNERERLEDQLIEAYVLDGVEFGSGKTFDWNSGGAEQIKALCKGKKLVLAGGLTPDNVAEGIALFAPDIVDVSSGVEKACGGKDEEKIKQFIRKVKQGRN